MYIIQVQQYKIKLVCSLLNELVCSLLNELVGSLLRKEHERTACKLCVLYQVLCSAVGSPELPPSAHLLAWSVFSRSCGSTEW